MTLRRFVADRMPLTLRRLIRPSAAAVEARVHRARIKVECAAADWSERHERAAGDWPPSLMRYRVHGATDLASYRQVGERCAGDVIAALRSVSVEPASLKSVLDFGAGCGRTIRFIAPQLPGARVSACDTDGDAIEWARGHIGGLDWFHTGELPPLPFDDASFDLVYAISVFTHLDERRQPAWLDELRRVTRPGGILLLTVHVSGHSGFRSEGNLNWKGLFPAWYQDVVHSEEYVRREFGREMSIIGWRERGMNAHQDVVILRRPV